MGGCNNSIYFQISMNIDNKMEFSVLFVCLFDFEQEA